MAPDAPPPALEEQPAGTPALDLDDHDRADSGGGPPTGRRVRARLARLTAPSKPGGPPPVLEPLLRTVKASHPKADTKDLVRAYEIAESLHGDQRRSSGDLYITHPLAVTTILAELGMDVTTLVAALLHDTVEDTAYTLADVKEEFGEAVEHLVDGVTKLDKIKYGEHAEAETIRKMVVAMARDPRVLVIKLADRLHNMRTLRYLAPEKQERIATATLEIFAPLAHRLGMNTIKWELEDLAFATLYPKRYDEIVRLVADRAPSRDTQLAEVVERVSADLKAAKIRATVTGRPKHYYSIYQKMIVRGRDFADIYDLVGIRILVDSVRDCYAALGAIHGVWSPVPGRFKDFIAMPKFNLYQSLHTTVIGPSGKPVELQIRTNEMHRRAEYGIAAHWKYKEGGAAPGQGARNGRRRHGLAAPGARLAEGVGRPGGVPRLAALRPALRRGLRLHPQGRRGLAAGRCDSGRLRVRRAHRGGAPLHRRAGQRPAGAARVDARQRRRRRDLHQQGRERPPVAGLAAVRQEPAGPQQDPAVVREGASRGRGRERQGGHRPGDAQVGPAAAAAARRRGAAQPHQGDAARRRHGALRRGGGGPDLCPDRGAAHHGRDGWRRGRRRGPCRDRRTHPARATASGGDPGVVVKGVPDVWVKLAKCCTPVPGDDVVGFVTRGRGVSVHRKDCTNAGDLLADPARLVEVEWAPTAGSLFLVNIQVEALDRTRLLSDVTRVLSDAHVNILSATVTTTRDRVAVSRFSFEMADPKHMGHLLAQVRSVEGVYDAYRVTS